MPNQTLVRNKAYRLNTGQHRFVCEVKFVSYLAGLFQLSASLPGFGEDGAHGTLRTDVASRQGVRHSTVRLIRVIRLRLGDTGRTGSRFNAGAG